MKILTLDCETNDPNLKTYGAGWCFKYHYPEIEFEVLGIGTIDAKGNGQYWDLTIDFAMSDAEVLQLIQSHDAILCHNALYDLGCLKYLFRDKLDLSKFTILDTMIMAKQVNQSLFSYSLDNLTKEYKCNQVKESDLLYDYAWLSGIYKDDHKKTTKRDCHTRPSANVLDIWCKTHMTLFPQEIVGKYCLQDCKATKELYEKLSPKVGTFQITPISDILKVCLDAKIHGMRINLTKARELSCKWLQIADNEQDIVHKMLGCPAKFNINSGKQLGQLLIEDGYNIPHTDKGNISLKDDWLEEQPGEIFSHIRRYRKSLKANKDFVQKLIKYQEVIPEKYRNDKVGVLYPSLKPYGATATGRFTSGGGTGSLELNVLAVSGHDEEFGRPIRELFLPHEGEQLVVGDFSNQEPRLQVHYATLLGCPGADKVKQAWIEDPNKKYHQTVADMTGLPYDVAKMITLGLAYDMRAKGLSVRLKVTYEEAEKLISKYHKLLPFMQSLQKITSKNILKIGYIKTIGGRKLYIDPAYEFMGKIRTQERKAMSKLIQGSGADQTMKAMINAYKAGLKVLLSVHDEIIVSSKNPKMAAFQLKNIMESSYELCVPVVAEVNIGNNWKEAK